MISLNGHPDGEPVRVTVPLVDVMTSLLVCNGVLAALRARDQGGEGQRIDIALLDAVVHAQCSGLGGYFLTGEVTPRTGNRSHYFAPSGIYPTADGKQVVITCPSQKFFRNLCSALDADWIEDERFATIPSRLANQDELDRLIAERTKTMAREEIIERLIAADVLTAPVQSIPEVAADPQVRHNEMIATVEHSKLGPIEVTSVPIHLRGTPGSVRLAPPVHGEHTAEVLAELGYSQEEIARLAESGAIKTA
ncbi:MAG: CoA transferase [Deltaproteobacteria bacterium]|nr:MAG: CoA transferase [Deltaproteobacteria bacterium]